MTEQNNLRNTAFEEFKRSHPNVKEIATLWRGSPEEIAWRELYLTEGQDFEYIENESVVTFYRLLTEKEIEKKEAAVTEAAKEPSKFYEDLGVVHDHSDEEQSHTQTWIKLSKPRIVPVGNRWAKIEFVLVDQFRQRIEIDGQPPFDYSTTRVLVSDDEKTDHTEKSDAEPLYLAQGWLDVWAALWAIGEIAQEEK